MRTRLLAAASLYAAALARPAAALPPNVASPVRAVARYEIQSSRREHAMRVTIADSAGTLVARYRVAGQRAEHPMVVTTEGTGDLLLSAIGARGPIQLLLRDQNGARRRTFTGEWIIGDDQGTFTGTVR